MKLTKRGDYYYYALYPPEGRKLISTHCTDREEAIRVIKSAGVEKMNEAARSVRLTHQSISYLIGARGLTIEKAAEQHAELLQINGSEHHAHYVKTTVCDFAKSLGILSDPPSVIAESHIDRYVNDPKSKNSYGTRRTALGRIASFLSFCMNNGWCFRNPAKLVKVNHRILTHEQKEPRAKVPYTAEEVQSIVLACRKAMLSCAHHKMGQMRRQRMEFWQAAVTIAWNTGLRLGDVAQLEWACFSNPGEIIVHTAKTNKRVEPELRAEVDAVVAALPRTDERYLFPHYAEMARDAQRRGFLPVDFSRLCREFKLPYKGFHSMRRGFATEKANAGESLQAIAKDLGHSSTKTTEVYVL